MATVKTDTMHICCYKSDFQDNDGSYIRTFLSISKPQDDNPNELGYIGEIDIQYSIPDEKTLELLLIDNLEAYAKRLQAEHQVKMNEVKEQIQKLKAISHDG